MADKDSRPKSCATCKHIELKAGQQPCKECCRVDCESYGARKYTKWEEPDHA